jgi:hypothetical protein
LASEEFEVKNAKWGTEKQPRMNANRRKWGRISRKKAQKNQKVTNRE